MSTKKGQYHVAINGQGYILVGSPTNPARTMKQARKYGENPERVDIEFADASQFFPFSQTDWSGGFQEEKLVDTATFKTGVNVDVYNKFGQVTLLNGVAGVKTNFGDGHTFGAHLVANDNLVIGTQHASTAELWYINNADSATEVTTNWTDIIKVKDMALYQDKVLLALERDNGSEATLESYDFSTLADLRTTSDVVRSVEVIGDRIYVAELNSTANGDRLIYSDDGGSTWTDIITKTGQNRQIIKMDKSYGVLYFLIQDGTRVELWEVRDVYPEPIYTFDYLSTPRLKAHLGNVYVSGLDEKGRTIVYEWTGAILTTSFFESVSGMTIDSIEPVEYEGNLVYHGITYDGEIWHPHIIQSISGGSALTPFATFGNSSAGKLYFYGTDSGSDLEIYKVDTSLYATTGNVITGIFYGNKPAITKLWYSVDVNFKALAAGEIIEVQYSVDNEVTWTSLGSEATDGANSATFYFPAGTTSRQIQFKTILTAGTNQATTPTLYDQTVRYKPMADERYQWDLVVKAIDHLKLLDERSEEKLRGVEVRNNLLVANETKSVVNFEDTDYFACELEGGHNATVTTITVRNTANAPIKGRFKIDNEWITYTGKTDNTFTGCTRGARGSTAASHSDGDTVHNQYKVLVRGYSEELRMSNESKSEETYVAVALEEV